MIEQTEKRTLTYLGSRQYNSFGEYVGPKRSAVYEGVGGQRKETAVFYGKPVVVSADLAERFVDNPYFAVDAPDGFKPEDDELVAAARLECVMSLRAVALQSEGREVTRAELEELAREVIDAEPLEDEETLALRAEVEENRKRIAELEAEKKAKRGQAKPAAEKADYLEQ